MAMSTDQRYEYVIQGTVVDRASRAGVQGLRVEAWDRDTRYHDMLGIATTDAAGRFTIGFQTAYFGDYAPDRAPDLFFKVFLDAREVLNTFEEPMRNVQVGTTVVTLEVGMPTFQNKGVDRVGGLQAIKMVNWWSQSDFRGVFEQGKDKGRTVGKVASALGMASLSKFELKPVRPSATKDSQIVNQSTLQAQQTLAQQNIQVTAVKDAGATNAKDLLALKDYPLALKAGDQVTLYQENGVVKYYTRTPKTKAAGVDAQKVAEIDVEMQAVKAQMQNVELLREEVAQIKLDSTASAQMIGDGSKGLESQAEEVSKLRGELAVLRKNTAEKDAEIAKLRTDLDSLRTAQVNLTTNIPNARLEALEKEILSLKRVTPQPLEPAPLPLRPREAEAVASPAAIEPKPKPKRPAERAARGAKATAKTTAKAKAAVTEPPTKPKAVDKKISAASSAAADTGAKRAKKTTPPKADR